MGKDKLKKFAENETFRLLIQPTTEQVLGCDHPLKGHWGVSVFGNSNPIVLELGCGKGEYTIALASRMPEMNFIGVDIKGARLWKGAKYATEHNMPNVAFLRTRIEFINSLFAENEVSGIWITFADPQLKKPRKRLTSPMFLERYRKFMRKDGVINLKTDSPLLHEYTAVVARANNLTILEKNTDIYGTSRADDILSVKTFYESHFLDQGFKITYLAFKLDSDAPFVEPQWDETPFMHEPRHL